MVCPKKSRPGCMNARLYSQGSRGSTHVIEEASGASAVDAVGVNKVCGARRGTVLQHCPRHFIFAGPAPVLRLRVAVYDAGP